MAVDAFLVKCRQSPDRLEDALREAAREARVDCASITVHAALAGTGIYAYAWLAVPASDLNDDLAPFTHALRQRWAMDLTVLPLQLLVDLEGASAGKPAPFHYVVEAGVDAEHESEFNGWYDSEHLPGLAAVPGCVRARRLRVLDTPDGRSIYLACYELVSPGALTSDAWLAVRRTPWSDRVRPTFRDTKRTVFRTMSPTQADAARIEN
ncbi:MAG TPA: hypothetical protein VGL25_04175 [Casimicrobiaceae bacterium]|jgi:hypothetical protein